MCDAARLGDREAIGRLLEAHYDRVHAVCRRMLGNDFDAADAAQDTLLLAVRFIGRFDGRSSFSTWIYRIATNACIDELRRRRRQPMVATDLDCDGGPRGGSAHGGSQSLDAVSGVAGFGVFAADPSETAAARVDVDAALSLLSVDFRAAVVLRDLCDLTYEEIAQILHVPVGTVRSRIARGRATLADLLQGAGDSGAGNSASPDDVKAKTGIKETAT